MSIKKISQRLFLYKQCIYCKNKTDLQEFGFCHKCFHSLTYFKNSPGSDRHHIFKYEDRIKDIIYKFKYGRQKFYAKNLAKIIGDYLEKNDSITFDYIIPTPLHWKKEFTRGFNQSAIISVYLGKFLQKKVLLNVLSRSKNTKSQTNMRSRERKENIKNCFKVKNFKSIKGTEILLVDDVYTTGTTTNEAKKVLLSAGARKVIIVTIAKT